MKVPTYQRQVGANLPQPAQPSPEAAGVGVAQAAGGLGSNAQNVGLMLAQHAIELQEREDARQTQEAETAFRKALDSLQYDQRNGLLNRQMSDAIGVILEFDQKAEELRQKYLNTLVGKNQKEQFGLAADSHIQAARGTILRYETEQMRKGEDTAYANALAADYADVARDPSQETLLRKIGDATNRINTYGMMRGWTQDAIDAQSQKVAGQMAAAAIAQQLASNNIAAAQAIYDQHADAIKAYSLDMDLQLRENIKSASLGEVSNTISLAYMESGKLASTDAFAGLVSSTIGVIETTYTEFGYSAEAIELEKRKFVTQAVTAQINAQLARKEEGLADAQALLDKYAQDLDGETAVKLQDVIDNAGFNSKVEELWETDLRMHMLADGYTYDLETINAKLAEIYSGEELERAKAYVKQLAAEAENTSARERAARQAKFLNGVSEIILNNGTMQQAIDLLNNTQGFTPYERDQNLEYIKSRFATPASGRDMNYAPNENPAERVRLRDNIANMEAYGINPGQLQMQIDAAREAGWISWNDWETLSNLLNTKLTSIRDVNKTEERRQVTDYIKQMANKLYPLDADKRNNFIYYYENETEGLNYTQAVEKINSETAGRKPVWESNAATIDEADAELPRFKNLLGTSVFNRVVESILLENPGIKKVTGIEFLEWEKQIGGLTPQIRNLIANMHRLNYPLTAANIIYFIKLYPDGNIPEASGRYGGR